MRIPRYAIVVILAWLSLTLGLSSSSSTAAPAGDDAKNRATALRSSFDFVNKNEFGRRSNVRSILAKDDVHAVVVTFISSMSGVPRETVLNIEALHDHYRKRGVAIIVSIEPGSGTKPIKEMLAAEGISVPVSFTGKQWDPFQKVAGSKQFNSWPWTFYIKKDGAFVHKLQNTPAKNELETVALPGDGTGPAAPPRPGAAGANADAIVQPPSKTLSEITVPRPAEGDWRFSGGTGGFAAGDSMSLVLPADKEGDTGSSMRTTIGAGGGAFSQLASNAAVVHVSTLDRLTHTSVGRTMVDPGSKGSILTALEVIYEGHADKLSKVRTSKNSRLGGQSAGKISAILRKGDQSTHVTAYAVPVRVHTYIVTIAHGPDLSEEAQKQVAEIVKGIRFKKGAK